MCILFILALAIAAGAAVPATSNRIIGGSVTTINQYPHMVATLYTNNWSTYSQACGGTILNARSILTAAHCLENDEVGRWRIRVGSTYANSGGIVHNVQQHILHPLYKIGYEEYDNDIAIMRTATRIDMNNSTVQAAYIAGPNYYPPDNSVVWAAGWGRTHVLIPIGSRQLKHVQIWTINQQICIDRNREVGVVNDNMLCAGWLDVGGRDQCTGDSGSPLYHNGIVVGICSWGYDCALPRYPSVNVRVSRYTAWIQANA